MKIPTWLPESNRPTSPDHRPRRAIVDPLLRPVARFLHVEAASGFVLLACTIAALTLANSAWSADFAELWQTPVGFHFGGFALDKPLLLWINDGAMTIFFFVIGLEIKRENVFGELRDPRKVALPTAAALGGMLVPAAIYLMLQKGEPGEPGWGIPMATDIAFVVGFLALLGPRVPFGLKILLLTLAIIDDIGAILVIAVAYTEKISVSYLVIGAIGFPAIYLVRWIGVRAVPVYVVLGAAIWYAFLKSGVHPTVAGVVLGLLTPADPWFGMPSLTRVAEGIIARLIEDRDETKHHAEAARLLTATARETISPLNRLETALHPWVAFVIMPIFALANAGVKIELTAVFDPVATAVSAALFFGKSAGIVLFSWGAVKLGLARLPHGVTWNILLGAGFLGGIGFTMSLFIAGLALDGDVLTAGKIGTLVGSGISAVVGLGWLAYGLRTRNETAAPLPS